MITPAVGVWVRVRLQRLAQADGPVAYKQALLTAYPDYAADKLIDIYSRILFTARESA